MKLRFKNILVIQNAKSESSRAIKLALDLAREKEGGKVTVVDFVQQPTWLWSEAFGDLDIKEATRKISSRLNRLLENVGANSEAGVEILTGRPITEIVKFVADKKYDLVIKDAFAETGELFLGSFDMRLMRYCPCPVLLTQPNRSSEIKTVLAAVDPEAKPTEEAINNEIIRQATSFAKLRSATLHIVAAWSMPGFNFDNSDSNLEDLEIRTLTAERKAKDNLTAIVDHGLDTIESDRIHLCHGDPYQCILDAVGEIQPDLLVIGSQSRIGIPGLLIGNTSEKVLRQVDCEVLTLKPDGFVSPIAA